MLLESQKPRARPYHHGDLRNALIVAGQALLAEEGVAGLDLRKVARRAGVSHAAPYRHFADRQALLAAIAEEGFRRLTLEMRAAFVDAPDAPEAQLLGIARAYVRFARERPAHMREMFGGLMSTREAYPALYAAAKDAFAPLLLLVQRGQEQGTVAPGDPERLAVVIWSLIHGFAMLLVEEQIAPVSGDEAAIDQLIALCVHTLHCGLARTP